MPGDPYVTPEMRDRADRGLAAIRLRMFGGGDVFTAGNDLVADVLHALNRVTQKHPSPFDAREFLDHAATTYVGDFEDVEPEGAAAP